MLTAVTGRAWTGQFLGKFMSGLEAAPDEEFEVKDVASQIVCGSGERSTNLH